ncbi:MAG TPA: hypothetical protein VFT58_03300, partial [Nitrososphaera sp.]|nr:hypothetical protein [Nitrososphaera sp.]
LLAAQTTLPLGNSPLETKIITLLQSGVRDGDILQQQSGASAAEFGQTLTMMELSDTVRALGANQWTLR